MATIPIRETLQRHKKVIIHSHNCGHTIYWTISAISAPSFGYGILATCLAVLTVGMAIMEE